MALRNSSDISIKELNERASNLTMANTLNKTQLMNYIYITLHDHFSSSEENTLMPLVENPSNSVLTQTEHASKNWHSHQSKFDGNTNHLCQGESPLMKAINSLLTLCKNNSFIFDYEYFHRSLSSDSFPRQNVFFCISKIDGDGCIMTKPLMKYDNCSWLNDLTVSSEHFSVSDMDGTCKLKYPSHFIDFVRGNIAETEKNNFEVECLRNVVVTELHTSDCPGIHITIKKLNHRLQILILNINLLMMITIPGLDKFHENILWSKNSSTQQRLLDSLKKHQQFHPVQKYNFEYSFCISFWIGCNYSSMNTSVSYPGKFLFQYNSIHA